MGGSSRTIPIDQFSKGNQRLNKQVAAHGGSHQGMNERMDQCITHHVGHRAVTVAAARTCNSLPEHITPVTSVSVFLSPQGFPP